MHQIYNIYQTASSPIGFSNSYSAAEDLSPLTDMVMDDQRAKNPVKNFENHLLNVFSMSSYIGASHPPTYKHE